MKNDPQTSQHSGHAHGPYKALFFIYRRDIAGFLKNNYKKPCTFEQADNSLHPRQFHNIIRTIQCRGESGSYKGSKISIGVQYFHIKIDITKATIIA